MDQYPSVYTSQLLAAIGEREAAGAGDLLTRLIAKGDEIATTLDRFVADIRDLTDEIRTRFPPEEPCVEEIDERYCWLDELANDLRISIDTANRIAKGETPEAKAARAWKRRAAE